MSYPDLYEGLEKQREHNQKMLLRALDGGTTVALVGSGVSKAFDYPGWRDFALKLLEKTQGVLTNEQPAPPELQDIERFNKSAKKVKSLSANALMFLIGTCRSALEQGGSQDVYKDFVEKNFGPPRPQPPENDPFKFLLELPIQRFVTTNYDCEVEQALVRYRSACARDLGLDPSQKADPRFCQSAFTQLKGTDRLVRFALAGIDEERVEVFHCHGRYDELDSVIATEEDYQHWYLGQKQGEPLTFQQNLELLLGSNPVLFVGYGLGDEDLLRPLRQLRVLEPARKRSRPLFALLSSRDPEGKDSYYHASLLERFGLHVIPFRSTGPKHQTLDLCAELKRLHDRLEEEHRQRSEKPKMRCSRATGRLPKPHCEIESAAVPCKPLTELAAAVRKPGVVALVGPSGSGKSHHLLQLLRSDSIAGFAGSFYWNAHYANEAFTALDAALNYFDPHGKLQGTRYDRISRCLREHRFLLVVDGCERFLRRSGTAGEGTSYSITFQRLLKAMMSPENQSTVVIAGRLLPAGLKESPGSPIRVLHTSRTELRDLAAHEPFTRLLKEKDEEETERDLSALCSLLRGHAYGLRLAGEYLQLCPPPRSPALRELLRSLTDKQRDERLHDMVWVLIDRLDSLNCKAPKSGLTRAFLERLALFLSPVCETTLKLCFEQAQVDFPQDLRRCEDLYPRLIEAGLLIPVHDLKSAPPTYTVHATVRAALFHSGRGPVEASLPAFGLSGFTSGRVGVSPDPASGQHARILFDRMIGQANQNLGGPKHGKVALDLCRDTFNLIRTRMEANTAPRWCTYDEYLWYGQRVAALVKSAEKGRWTYCEYPDAKRFTEEPKAPLYPAELAWLYNDIALALSAQGYVNDACSFWEQTYEICRLIEDPVTGGGYHLEVLLSLAFTSIERGRLAVAVQYLEDAERLLQPTLDEDYTARVLGLRGLMAHLQGNLQKASDLYERCLGILRSGTNLRAQSVFLKHLADIKITMQQFAEADMLIRDSRAVAESGVFPELVANARISEGHRLSRTGNPVPARLEYNAVLSEARRIGLRKLEVRALTALSRLALDQKDTDRAHELAMQALCLSNELGLGLRQSHCLVVLGLVALAADQKELGIAYLRLAKRMADGQQYWARSREAENKLLELGVDPRDEADRSPGRKDGRTLAPSRTAV